MAYRIGVVSDTHCPEFAAELPARLFEAFRGCDLILHAGDVTEQATLDQLRAIAPVLAVKGNHDRNLELPLTRLVEAGGVRIGVVHGHRGRVREFPGVAWSEGVAGRIWWWNGALGHIRRQFAADSVDAIVFGHYHRPHSEWQTGPGGRALLMFSPGATYHCVAGEARRRFDRGGPAHHRLYYLSRMRWRERPVTAGILEICDGAIRPEIVEL